MMESDGFTIVKRRNNRSNFYNCSNNKKIKHKELHDEIDDEDDSFKEISFCKKVFMEELLQTKYCI